MFREHQIICENKKIVLYLFLFEQEIELDTMKTLFAQIPSSDLELWLGEYLQQQDTRFFGTRAKIVYHSTIIRDFQVSEQSIVPFQTEANNVINFHQ